MNIKEKSRPNVQKADSDCQLTEYHARGSDVHDAGQRCALRREKEGKRSAPRTGADALCGERRTEHQNPSRLRRVRRPRRVSCTPEQHRRRRSLRHAVQETFTRLGSKLEWRRQAERAMYSGKTPTALKLSKQLPFLLCQAELRNIQPDCSQLDHNLVDSARMALSSTNAWPMYA
eukprot:6178248-Pleurochrysis_carterae.AAC.2